MSRDEACLADSMSCLRMGHSPFEVTRDNHGRRPRYVMPVTPSGSPSKQPDIFRRAVEAIMPTIKIVDGLCQLIGVGVIERGDSDEAERTALRPQLLAAADGANAAGSAKAIMQVRGGPT